MVGGQYSSEEQCVALENGGRCYAKIQKQVRWRTWMSSTVGIGMQDQNYFKYFELEVFKWDLFSEVMENIPI
jgi:hypothetical protein